MLRRYLIRRIPWLEGDFEVAQLMIWHQDKWLSPIMKEFMDTAREVLKIK